MCAAIIIQLALFGADVFRSSDVRNTVSELYYVIPNVIIYLILLLGVSKRRKWARTGYLIFFILGIVCLAGISAYSRTLIINENVVMYLVFDIAVLYLLFKKESSAWFKSSN